MDIKQKTGLAIGAGVIGIGAAFSVAWAVTGPDNTANAQGAAHGRPPGAGRGPGERGMRGMTNLAAALAVKLGVDQSTVTEAIQSAMQANRPAGVPSAGGQASPGPRPSAGAAGGMDPTLAKAIAVKLGLDEAKVTRALQEVRSEQQANGGGNGGGGNPNPQPSKSA